GRSPHLVASTPRPGHDHIALTHRPPHVPRTPRTPRTPMERPVQGQRGDIHGRELPGSTRGGYAADRGHLPLHSANRRRTSGVTVDRVPVRPRRSVTTTPAGHRLTARSLTPGASATTPTAGCGPRPDGASPAADTPRARTRR
ncbi:hypothetical protein, partial [Streptomyces sp. NPDC057052]|uniref:hypothetical protein n=1 Tax=Streptomyces sp. NPDC057052 TaxID=3346010 RepID=UPI00363A24DC